jgi:predicted RNA-binding protein with RPS1 domain
MAENKKSFVLYTDSQGLVNQLPDDVAGRLFKHIYAYVNDEQPITEELLLNIAFEPIKMQLKRDLTKWKTQLEQRKQAGLKSAEVRKRNATKINERSISSTDNVNVNVNVNDINKDSKANLEIRSLAFKNSLIPFKNKYQIDLLKNFFEYWTEPNPSKTKMRFELERTWSIERRLTNWASRQKDFNKQTIKQDRL